MIPERRLGSGLLIPATVKGSLSRQVVLCLRALTMHGYHPLQVPDSLFAQQSPFTLLVFLPLKSASDPENRGHTVSSPQKA